MALKGTRFARRMVSSRDVAVTMCDDPAVSDVYTYSAGSVEYDVAPAGAAPELAGAGADAMGDCFRGGFRLTCLLG